MEVEWEPHEFDAQGFEWHDEKAQGNKRKHNVGFEEAAQIFGGKVLARHEVHETESRYVAIGFTATRPLVVVFTERQGNIRIISARKATPSERRRYGSHFI